MGKAWGLNCESCPTHGGSDYKAMCGSGPPGVMVNPMTNQTEEIDECELMPGITFIIILLIFAKTTGEPLFYVFMLL